MPDQPLPGTGNPPPGPPHVPGQPEPPVSADKPKPQPKQPQPDPRPPREPSDDELEEWRRGQGRR